MDKDGPETVPEVDSDFEEITIVEKQTVCNVIYSSFTQHAPHIVYKYIYSNLTIENDVTRVKKKSSV